MEAEQIICIFCGAKADIVNRNGELFVHCPQCNRETEGHSYQIMFDNWLGDVRKTEI